MCVDIVNWCVLLYLVLHCLCYFRHQGKEMVRSMSGWGQKIRPGISVIRDIQSITIHTPTESSQ